MSELEIESNDYIKKNMAKIKNNLIYIRENIEKDEDENNEQIYYKINIYYNSLINKIKIKYIEALDKFKNQIKQYENDILKLIMENILLKIENNSLKKEKNSNDTSKKYNFKKLSQTKKQTYKSVDNLIKNRKKNKVNAKTKKFELNDMENYIKKQRQTQSFINIRKIKDEMDLIIKKNKKNNFKKLNDDKKLKNNFFDDIKINSNINEEITRNFFLKENPKNIIHNTSINIFNTSNDLYSINNINYKNYKNNFSKKFKNKEKNKNSNIINLKTLYENLQSKKKLYNNTNLKNTKKEKNLNVKTNPNNFNDNNDSINLFFNQNKNKKIDLLSRNKFNRFFNSNNSNFNIYKFSCINKTEYDEKNNNNKNKKNIKQNDSKKFHNYLIRNKSVNNFSKIEKV